MSTVCQKIQDARIGSIKPIRCFDYDVKGVSKICFETSKKFQFDSDVKGMSKNWLGFVKPIRGFDCAVKGMSKVCLFL